MSAPVASTSAVAPLPPPPPPPSSSSATETHGTNSTASPPSNAATGPSSPRLSSPTFPPVCFRAASATASRTTTSPPTTSTTTTTTTTTTEASTTSATGAMTAMLNPTLPSQSTQLHITEARAALVASVSNMLDSELQSRAGLLHANAAALGKQERDVARATEGLRKENDKLAKVAKDAGRKIKELGNVQNWAEVLERDFLVLEETMRLVRGDGGSSGDEGDGCSVCSGSCFCSWSGSESARSRSPSPNPNPSPSRRGSAVRDRAAGDKKEVNGSAKDKSAAKDASTTNGTDAAAAVSASNVNVLVDDALLESLTEAMATEMRVSRPAAPGQGQGQGKDGPLGHNGRAEKKDDEAPPPPSSPSPPPAKSTAPSTSSAGEEVVNGSSG